MNTSCEPGILGPEAFLPMQALTLQKSRAEVCFTRGGRDGGLNPSRPSASLEPCGLLTGPGALL